MNGKPFPINLGGLNTTTDADASRVYPDAIAATNVRWSRNGALKKRAGYSAFNLTGMPGTKMAMTGVFPLNLRDGSTRYTIACSRDRIFLVPASGAWTALVSSLTGADSDFWEGCVFNNELILINGVDAPQVTNGTAGGSGALVGQAGTQARTSMTTAQVLAYGLHAVSDATLVAASGKSATGTYDGITQVYDTIGDVWATRQRASLNREAGVGFSQDGLVYVSSGNTTGAVLTALGEVYDHNTDTWKSIASVTAARRQGVGASSNNGGFSITGNDNAGSDAWTTANYFYDPIANTWATKTAFSTDPARRGSAGFVISQNPHVISGTITAADAYDAEHGSYNPFSDAWTDQTDITAARAFAGGVQGQDNLGYVVAGMNSSDADQTTIYSYNKVTDAWATPTMTLSVAKNTVGCASDDWMVYVGGGQVGSTANAVMERFNAAPAAPVAKYITSYKGQVLMARSSSYPSRLYYSAPGNARVWDPFAYIDINPDDGNIISGMFVYDGRLYVAKSDTVYLISGDAPFDPIDAIPNPIPLSGVSGCLSNRSIIITDIGVFYLSEKGFEHFDGSRSRVISDKIYTTIEAMQQGLLRNTCGVWNRKRNELWWSVFYSSTYQFFVFNLTHNKWSLFTGIDAICMTVGEDSNDVDEIWFGVADTTYALLYVADRWSNKYPDELRGDAVDGTTLTAISSTYQTGWFSPVGGFDVAIPKDLLMWWGRTGITSSPVVSLRSNFSGSDTVEAGVTMNDTVAVAAGSGKTNYFEDGTDQRSRIQLSAASTSNVFSLRITQSVNTTDPWELYQAVLTYNTPLADGSYPMAGA